MDPDAAAFADAQFRLDHYSPDEYPPEQQAADLALTDRYYRQVIRPAAEAWEAESYGGSLGDQSCCNPTEDEE